MDNALKVRKIVQDVLKSVWHKHRFLWQKQIVDLSFIQEIPSDFSTNLFVAVWMQSFRNEYKWEGFWKKHADRMTESGKLFANYVSYAFYALIEDITNPYEAFFYVLSLLVYFSIQCFEEGCRDFLCTNVDLFCAFYEKELCKLFENGGSWEEFNDFLTKNCNLTKYLSLLEDNIWPYDYFNKPKDATEREIKHSNVIQYFRLERITKPEVETDENSVSFAKSIADKMESLRCHSFRSILIDFRETENQLKRIELKKMEESSSGVTKTEEQSSQKVSTENIPSSTSSQLEIPAATASNTQLTDEPSSQKVSMENIRNNTNSRIGMPTATASEIQRTDKPLSQKVSMETIPSNTSSQLEMPTATASNTQLTDEPLSQKVLMENIPSDTSSHLEMLTAKASNTHMTDESSSQKVSMENIPNNTSSQLEMPTAIASKTQNSENDFPNVEPNQKLSHLQTSTKFETARTLVEDISMDLSKMSGVVNSICEEDEVPFMAETDSKTQNS